MQYLPSRSFAPSLTVAVVLMLVLGIVPLAAQATTIPYYHNGLVYTLGNRQEPGVWNRLHLSKEGLLFAVRWDNNLSQIESHLSQIESIRIDPKSYIPTFLYLKADGSPLLPATRTKLMAAHPFYDGRARAMENDREALYGFLGPDGQWAIMPRFAEAFNFTGGLALAREKAGLWGVIDTQGRWVLSPRFTKVYSLESNGLVVATLAQESEIKHYDARSGISPEQTDPRFKETSNYDDQARYRPYRVEESRNFEGGACMFGRVVNIMDPAGKVVSPGVFNSVQEIRSGIAVVSLGYYGDNWSDGPVSSSYGPQQGAFGLLDLRTMRFLIPPSASQIISRGPGRWYVRTHEGQAYVYDDVSKKIVETMPNIPMLWFAGSLGVGLNNEYRRSRTQPGEKVELQLQGSINDDRVRMRSRPTLNGDIITELARGTSLKVLEFNPAIETIGDWTGIWARVETREGSKGWVFSYFIDLLYYSQ